MEPAGSHRSALLNALRIGTVDPETDSFFDVKRAFGVPAWPQATAVVVCFVATIFLTYREYRATGTVFGFSGPAFNVLIAPIYEELIFRGWILSKLVRRHANWFAILISSFLFGILHLRNIYWLEPDRLIRLMIFTGLILSPILGYITLKCRSVWPAVILHYLNNLTFYL